MRNTQYPTRSTAAWRAAVTQSQQIEARLAGVRFEGLKRVNPEYLVAKEHVKAGDVVDTVAISKEAQRMSALQDFESVGYRLDGDRESPTLTWLPREKNWGPNYLKLDLGAYASWDGDLTFNLSGRHVRTWVNSLGAEWRNEVQIGGEVLAATSFFQPLDAAHRFFVEPRVAFSRSLEDIFQDNERVARYLFQDVTGLLDAGINLGRYAQARVGYAYDHRDVSVDIGSALLPEITPIDAGLRLDAAFDNRDTAFSPTRGYAMDFEYMKSDSSLGADRDWERAEIGLGVAVPFRNDVLWVTLAGGSDLGSALPPDRAFALGGPSSFPGLELGELRVDGYWTIDTSYLWRVKEGFSIRNLALYAGIRLQAGAVYDRFDTGESEDIYGGSLFLTGRTLVGPLTVGVGMTSTDSWSAWLSIGRPVGHGTILDRGVFR